ncbi:MAG: AAA family ATPase [Proteobacteria bacterium]|nr:AAA family ATPase [Pseudomonadota bacterium]
MVESNSIVPIRPNTKVPETIPSKQKFFITRLPEFPRRKINWLVDGILVQEELTLVYGEPGCGKSFFAVDLGACVATGLPWKGREVQQGDVIYMAGESRDGIARRAHAWSIANEIDVPTAFGITSYAIDLNNSEKCLPEIQKAIEEVNYESVKMIIVDTLARHYSGDENTALDMSGFVRTLDQLKQFYSATILVVHHSGKAHEKGPRGSTALRGALDTEICIKKEKGKQIITNTKQREAESFEPMSFQFIQVNMTDDDGEPITSGVLEQVGYVEKQKVPIRGNNQLAFVTCFTRLVDETKSENQVEAKTLRDRLKEKLNKTDQEMKTIWYDLQKSKAIGTQYQFTGKFITKLTDPEELEGWMGGTP